MDINGGIILEPGVILHEKTENISGRNCAYWPHYSLHPSVIRTSSILKIGNYDSQNSFFERDYANKYYANGYRTAFFNSIFSLHIGKQHWEKEGKNAYALNAIGQFKIKKEEVITEKVIIDEIITEEVIIDININKSTNLPLSGTMRDHLNTIISKIENGNNFGLIRPSDGEYTILKGKTLTNCDNWTFDANKGNRIQNQLLIAIQTVDENLYIGIPCNTCNKPWNCTDIIYNDFINTYKVPIKQRTYANIFGNSNWQVFSDFMKSYKKGFCLITSGTTPTDELIIKERFIISPLLVNNWNKIGDAETDRLRIFIENKQNELICFSAGPISKIWIPICMKINPNNIYLDIGASLDIYTKGTTNRLYTKSEHSFSKESCVFKDIYIPTSENLVYLCVFHNKDYIELLKILMKTVKFYSNTNTIDFLIFTNKIFENDINNISKLLDIPLRMKFFDFDTYVKALYSRIFIFDYEHINHYKKILYIDTDIIIQNDLTTIFNLNIDDKIYALKEGTIEHEYHGGWFFDFNTIDKNIEGMNSGIMLFQNTDSIKKIFNDINEHINSFETLKKQLPSCIDQPFINYHFIKNNKQDVILLDKYCKIYCIDPPPPPSEPTDITICHFVWPIGNANHKKNRMISHINHILNNHKNIYISNDDNFDKNVINNNIYKWNSGIIRFDKNNLLHTSWAIGNYKWLDKYTIEASWSGFSHVLKMNELYNNFISIRKNDIDYITGKLISKIPKIFFQTSKNKLEDWIIKMIKNNLSEGWEYKHFVDSEIIDFFKNNPHNEFPDIINKFNSIKYGEHKADLFRYYYLFINGGVFMDSDAMIFQNIDMIIKDYKFVSVNSTHIPNSIFQGIIATEKQNSLIYKALKSFYNMNLNLLDNNYHYLCKELYQIYNNNICNNEYKLYKELKLNKHDNILNDDNIILFKHYWADKSLSELRSYAELSKAKTLKSKNLVYFCVFYNEDYFKLLNLLIKSVKFYSNNLQDIDFLIITHKNFEHKIYNLCNELNIYIYIKCFNFNTIFQASCARLFIFDYEHINNYEKILYLDTDILIKGELSIIFNLEINDLLYGIESGTINSPNFGGQFFDFTITDKSTLGINSGTLLFKNTCTINNLFSRIINHIQDFTNSKLPIPYCMDQPFINYHAIKNNLYDNKVLNPYVSLYESSDIVNNYSTSIVCHFAFPIGNFKHKYDRMIKFFHDTLNINTLDLSNTLNINTLDINTLNIINKEYSFGNGYIKFHETKLETQWGNGKYDILSNDTLRIYWNNHYHIIKMQNNFNNFISIRTYPRDFDLIKGNIKIYPNKSNKKEILIYNGFPFHYEMFGFILDFCNKYKINATIVNKFNDEKWIELYKKKYEFNCLQTLPLNDDLNHYLFVLLLTDDDMSFPNSHINSNIVCIDHFYQNRRPLIKYHIPIIPFNNDINNYVLPIFEYIDYNTKIEIIKQNNRPIITFIGSSGIPQNKNALSIISNLNDFDIYIINRHIDKNLDYIKLPNIYLFENISATEMFKLLLSSNYICYIPNNTSNSINQQKKYAMTACLPLSFSTGCKLIFPEEMNNFLKLESIIKYNENSIINLDTNPSLIETFKERDRLLITRDNSIFNLEHMTCKIPKKIIQTWENKDISPEFQNIINSWKNNNPEYEYYLFDKNERIQFIKENFDKNILNVYNSIIPGANKADFFRYCYLYINGGFCIDIDTLCIGKIDDFLSPNIEIITPIDLNMSPNEGTYNLACGFIGSIPKHQVFLDNIDRIVYNIKNNMIPQSPLEFTGPGIFGKSVNKYIGNKETETFIGKEGILNNICFLKFEKNTEYVKDTNNNILFQNKNGNQNIINLYNNEYNRLKDYVSWLSSSSKIKKDIAVMIYGQFRSYKNNLKKNINMLSPIFKNNNIHIFILSDKLEIGNYSKENEKEIINIFKEFNFNIHFFDYVENYNNIEENEILNSYFKNIKNNNGTNKFVPRLIYRKYLLNKLKNDYINSYNIKIDLTIFCRLFDIQIENNLSFNKIENEINKLYYEKNTLLGSSDTFFIGSQDSVDYLFSLSKLFKEGKLYNDIIWEDKQFVNFISSMDICLYQCKAIYSPEIQYIAHMYYNNNMYNYKNIRVDFNNMNSELNNFALYNIKLDPLRFKLI